MYTILVVDPDRLSRSATISALQSSGFETLEAGGYASALETKTYSHYHASIIDYELPDGAGTDLVRQLQKSDYTNNIPTIMLTPSCNDVARVLSLQHGADDAISKPISLNELALRLNNLLRKAYSKNNSGSYLSGNGINLDLQSLQVSINGKNTDLSLSEFRLLYHFMRNPNKAITRNELRDLTKGHENENKLNERSIDVYVMRLRKSLQQHGCDDRIKTVRGIGYKFNA